MAPAPSALTSGSPKQMLRMVTLITVAAHRRWCGLTAESDSWLDVCWFSGSKIMRTEVARWVADGGGDISYDSAGEEHREVRSIEKCAVNN